MRFVSTITVFTLFAWAQAFVIPPGTSDGVYSVFNHEDGTEVHTKISVSSEVRRDATGITPFNEVGALERRQNDRIWCGCGFNMDAGNCDAAVADLKSQMSAQSQLADPWYSLTVPQPCRTFFRQRGTVFLLHPRECCCFRMQP